MGKRKPSRLRPLRVNCRCPVCGLLFQELIDPEEPPPMAGPRHYRLRCVRCAVPSPAPAFRAWVDQQRQLEDQDFDGSDMTGPKVDKKGRRKG